MVTWLPLSLVSYAEQRSCLNKTKRYSSRGQAARYAKRLRKDLHDLGLRHYYCIYCSGYHVGHDKRLQALLNSFGGGQRKQVDKAMKKFLDLIDA